MWGHPEPIITGTPRTPGPPVRQKNLPEKTCQKKLRGPEGPPSIVQSYVCEPSYIWLDRSLMRVFANGLMLLPRKAGFALLALRPAYLGPILL